MTDTTTDLAALVASVRDLLIHADSTLSLLRHRGGIRRWGGGIPEQYEVDHLIGELRASYSPKGLLPALLDAAQSAQQRAEAAERERDEPCGDCIALQATYESDVIALVEVRNAALSRVAALREALAWYADRGNWVPQDVGGFFPRSRAQLDDGTMARAALAAGEGTA